MKYSLMIFVLLLGFYLRITQLDTLPPGLSDDEAVNVIDSFHLLHSGNFPVYEDFGRPEPLYRVTLALSSLAFGASVWAFRFTTAVLGTISLVTAFWSARQVFYQYSRWRDLAAVAAAAALCVAISHITLSRALYRAILQPIGLFLFIGFLMRGERNGRRRDYLLSGFWLAVTLYTYTAALVLPLALLPYSVLLWTRRSWRVWLPNMLYLALAFGLLLIPVGLRFLDNPTAVVGRSMAVSQGVGSNLIERLQAMLGQFFLSGDNNPQYNVAQAPLLPSLFAPLFIFGGLMVLRWWRRPSSWLLVALGVLATVPVISSSEVPHGLRVMGEFAVFPLVIAAGVVGLGLITQRLAVLTVALVVVTALSAVQATATYQTYWTTPAQETIYGRDLPRNEWFFRTDRRDFARWINEQTTPLLIPVEELDLKPMRAWLATDYPNTRALADLAAFPAQMRLVVPWSLELGDLRRTTRQYALLQNGVISLLPPFTADLHAALLADLETDGQAIGREGGVAFLGYVRDLPADLQPRFEPFTVAGAPALFADEWQVDGWRGAETLHAGETVSYALQWSALRRIGHFYSDFLQIQTADYQRIVGDDQLIWRWLFPTSQWTPADAVSDLHTFMLPPTLAPGAYRLVVGAYISTFTDKRLPANSVRGVSDGTMATIGWLKVPFPDAAPQTGILPAQALPLDATLGDDFALRGSLLEFEADGTAVLTLMWQAVTQRPLVDATIFVHVFDTNGHLIAQSDSRPRDGLYPTVIWDAGEWVYTTHRLDVQAATTDAVQVYVGMYTQPDFQRLAAQQNGQLALDGRVDAGQWALPRPLSP